MQFNFVVSTNTRAIALWEPFGFDVVGRLPGALEHPRLGMRWGCSAPRVKGRRELCADP